MAMMPTSMKHLMVISKKQHDLLLQMRKKKPGFVSGFFMPTLSGVAYRLRQSSLPAIL
jgi:hypothetical protein